MISNFSNLENKQTKQNKSTIFNVRRKPPYLETLHRQEFVLALGKPVTKAAKLRDPSLNSKEDSASQHLWPPQCWAQYSSLLVF